jgi:formylglycine-generating enzyme required for sulfatase activity/class 3 adenylate cyclase
MEEQDIKRKLATILVADIVGFSRLAATDEDWTIRSLGEFRKIVDEIIERHDGRIFNTGGDSILAEFASPVEAVRCAVDFQEAARSRNLLQPRDRQLRFRIGINLGDVMVRGTDLLGDGVNVAARLEGIAEPGGICVSGTVWDQINGKLSIGYVDIGEQSVKNIPRPVRAYHLRVDGSIEEMGSAGHAAAPPSRSGRGVIAALVAAGVVIVLLAGGLIWQLWPKSPAALHTATTMPAPVRTPTPAAPAPKPAQPAPAPSPTSAPAPPSTVATPAPPPSATAPQSATAAPVASQAATTAPPTATPKTFRDCPNCPEMVVIPAGSYMMGGTQAEHLRLDVPSIAAARDQPQHPVTIAKPFALAKFDITRAEFAAFAAATNFHPLKGCMTGAVNGNWQPQEQATWEEPGFAQTDRDPVVCMNQIEIEAYLGWLRRVTGKTYRLPSEAEWEYAARGGTTTSFYWGDEVDKACTYENVGDQAAKEKNGFNLVIGCNDGFSDTSPVGSFKPNPFGLYDMLGNIFVFTADCWNETFAGAPDDGTAWSAGDCTRRAARKATFNATRGWSFRAANRIPEIAGSKRNRFGFRVALSLP